MGAGTSRRSRRVAVSPINLPANDTNTDASFSHPIPTDQTALLGKDLGLSKGRSQGISSTNQCQRPGQPDRSKHSSLAHSSQPAQPHLDQRNHRKSYQDLQAEISRLKMTVNRQGNERAELHTELCRLKDCVERHEREAKSLAKEIEQLETLRDEALECEGIFLERKSDVSVVTAKQQGTTDKETNTPQGNYDSSLVSELTALKENHHSLFTDLAVVKSHAALLSRGVQNQNKDSMKSAIMKLVEISGTVLDKAFESMLDQISFGGESRQVEADLSSCEQLEEALAAAKAELAGVWAKNKDLATLLAQHQQTDGHEQPPVATENSHLPLGSFAMSYNGYVGTVMYVGGVEFATGTWIGLELNQPILGSSSLAHNGQVGGKAYFVCKANHGILLRSEDVCAVNGEEMSQLTRVKQMTFSQLATVAKGVVRFQAAYRGHSARKRIGKKISFAPTAFSAVDIHALKATDQHAATIKSLSAYLQEACTNQLLYVRAVYRWICANVAYDTDAYFSGKRSSSSAGNVLSSRKAVCAGYASFFTALCRTNGLDCEVVEGYSKGYGYRDGDSFRNKRRNHAWNAVFADGKWILVDSCWGAGFCDENHRFRTQFNEHQFAAKPEHFVLTHWPETERWQLLDEPLTLEQFEKTASPKMCFFQLGLGLLSHTNSIIQAPSGQIEINLSNPLGAMLLADVKTVDKSKKFDNRSLIQTRDKISTITVHLPSAGAFLVSLFGHLPSLDGRQKNSKERDWYEFLLSYTVCCKVSKLSHSRCFPEIYTAFRQAPGAYIFTPVTGTVPRLKKRISFHLALPTATTVAVVISQTWTKLQRDSNGEWKGEVEIGSTNPVEDIYVYAQFPAASDEDFDPFHYTGILKYFFEKAK